MDLQIDKWGNSLAIRPAQWNRQAFARELTEARNAMSMGEPVVEALRSAA